MMTLNANGKAYRSRYTRRHAAAVDTARRGEHDRQEIGSIANLSASSSSAISLSVRERLIVLLMARGLSDNAIAHRLSVTPGTVRSNAKRIYSKLAVQTRAQAVYRAAILGLI